MLSSWIKWNDCKGPGKRGHIVADTLLPTQMFRVCPRAQHLLGTQILYPGHKKCFWFCSETFCVRNKCFPVCARKEHHEQQCFLVCQGLKVFHFSNVASPSSLLIRELTNRRLLHDGAVRLRDMLTAHASLSTCQLRAKVDDVGESDLPASWKQEDVMLVFKVFSRCFQPTLKAVKARHGMNEK